MMKLSDDAIIGAVSKLSDWDYRENSLNKAFTFRNFVEAFGFMSRVALCAERADHHPDWSNSYRTVNISLTTHSEGGVTQKDIDLASQIEVLANPV